MPVIDDVRASRDMAERSDDFAYTNGTIARIDDEIRRLSAMTPAQQLLDAQEKQGSLTAEQQRKHFEAGMLVKIYDVCDTSYPWHTGRIVKTWANDCTMEDTKGIRRTAPYGPRWRIVGYIVEPPRRVNADLFGPLQPWERRK